MTTRDISILPAGDRFELDPTNSSGLSLRVRGGVRLDNGYKSCPNITLTLTDDAVSYIEVNDAGVISANTSSFTPGRSPLYEVTTASGVVTACKDWRGNPSLGEAGSAIMIRSEAAALSAGDLIYVSGWDEAEGLPLVTKADANASGKQAQFVVRSAIAQNANGMAFVSWRSAANINTNAVTTAGDPVYLSETAAGWTETAPTAAGSSVQVVGHCAVKSATVGVIEFDVRDFPTVGTNDIQALAITNALLGADAVDGAKIGDDAVNSEHIATGAIDPEHFAALSVETAAIAAGAVTSAKLAAGAGVAALLTAGLGGSGSVLKTDTLTHTLVAAHATKDRACIVMVVVDETYAVGTGTLPALVIGEADTTNKAMTAGTLDTEAAGTVLFFAFTNTATKAITATSTAAVGNATGGCSITVLAIPTT